jgi:DNA-binding XRE family transcriptional regulator
VANSQTQQFRAEASSGFAAQALLPDDEQPYSEREFLALLGDRVRGMRMLRDMSRRELARKSGISERYIAQIEAGKGNVSIVLLLRIAHAFRCGNDDAA